MNAAQRARAAIIMAEQGLTPKEAYNTIKAAVRLGMANDLINAAWCKKTGALKKVKKHV